MSAGTSLYLSFYRTQTIHSGFLWNIKGKEKHMNGKEKQTEKWRVGIKNDEGEVMEENGSEE